MDKGITKVSLWIAKNNVLTSIRKGFMLLLPITMMGAMTELLKSFPLQVVQDFWLANPQIYNVISILNMVSFDYISIYLLFAISNIYASCFNRGKVSMKIVSCMVNFSCFLASFGGLGGNSGLKQFGTSGIFTAIICSIIGTKLFFTFFDLEKKKLKDSSYYMAVNDFLSPIIPAMLTVIIFIVVNVFVRMTSGVSNYNDLILNGCIKLFSFTKLGIGTTLLFSFFENLLWIFGIHGSNILTPVGNQIFFQAGTEPVEFASVQFHDLFGTFGGSGATLCLILAILLFSNSKSNRKLGKASLLFGAFNINEPILFGLPIVLNPILAIPFFTVPLFSLSVSALFFKFNLMSIVATDISWVTPPLLSGYLATGSAWGVIAQLIGIVGGILIYAPFVILLEKINSTVNDIMVEEFIQIYFHDTEKDLKKNYLSRTDRIGITAKEMVIKLREDTMRSNIPVYYQPQVDDRGQVIGAEALLRWQYNGRCIPPPLAVSLSQQDEFYDGLTFVILKNACESLVRFKESITEEFYVSVNITAFQLNDAKFVNEVIKIAKQYKVEGNLGLELTEDDSISNLEHVEENINLLSENGISLSIDDFSMGKTSLKYLRDNKFAYVKIDGSLVKQIYENERCKDIIESIINLGHKLNYKIVAEYVENEEIKQMLEQLNCTMYQGYLFGKAVPEEEFLERFR